jgi:hypothetical protein
VQAKAQVPSTRGIWKWARCTDILILVSCLYDTIRAILEVGKNILEVTDEKQLRWFGHVKRMPQKISEWETEGTQRKGRPNERWKYGIRQSMTIMD